MTATYLLIAVFFVWSMRTIQSLWRAGRGDRLTLSFVDEISTAAFALCTWYFILKSIAAS